MAPHQKLFRFEVDQSNRIEDLNKNSIVSVANAEFSYTAMLPKDDKRLLRQYCRNEYKQRQFAPRVFAAAIVLIIQTMRLEGYRANELTIDREYEGYEKYITDTILLNIPGIFIDFKSIGKKSLAHKAAYQVFRKNKKADAIISVEKVKKCFIKL